MGYKIFIKENIRDQFSLSKLKTNEYKCEVYYYNDEIDIMKNLLYNYNINDNLLIIPNMDIIRLGDKYFNFDEHAIIKTIDECNPFKIQHMIMKHMKEVNNHKDCQI